MFQKLTAVSKLPFKFLQGFTYLTVEFPFFYFFTSALAATFQIFFLIKIFVQESIMKKFRVLN